MVKAVVVRKPDIPAVTGISLETVKRLEREGRFPRRRQLSDGSVGWLMAEIEAWAAALPKSELGLRGERPRRKREIADAPAR